MKEHEPQFARPDAETATAREPSWWPGCLQRPGRPAVHRLPGYKGVCGDEVLMTDPFVDGYLFTRAMDVKKGVGVIMCWDLRQPKGN